MRVLIAETGREPERQQRRARSRSRARVGPRSLALTLCLLAAWVPDMTAQRLSEHEVKAAFLFNFARFTEWPGGGVLVGRRHRFSSASPATKSCARPSTAWSREGRRWPSAEDAPRQGRPKTSATFRCCSSGIVGVARRRAS